MTPCSFLSFSVGPLPLAYFLALLQAHPAQSTLKASEVCQSTCAQYENQKKSKNTSHAVASLGMVGPHCDAKTLLELSEPLNITATTLYTAAAITCWVACFASATPLGPPATLACSITGGVNLAFDLSSTIAITAKGSRASDWWSQKMGLEWGGFFSGVAGETASIASQTIAKTATAKQASSCAAAGLFSIGAAVKGASLKKVKDYYQKECQTVETLVSPAPSLIPAGQAASSSFVPTLSSQVPQQAQKGTLTGPPSVSTGFYSIPSSEAFPQGGFSQAASSSPFNSLLEKMPDLKEAPKTLDSLGLSLDQLARQLQEEGPTSDPGSLMGQALASLSPPAGLSDSLQELDQLAKTDQIQMPGLQSPTDLISSAASAQTLSSEKKNEATSSLEKPGTPSSSSWSGLSLSGSSQLSSEITFEAKQARKPASTTLSRPSTVEIKISPQDIWHQNDTGTLFEIISRAIRNRPL